MKNRLDISDATAISMPMKNLLAIISAVAVGVWAYFGVLERITMLETKAQLSEKDCRLSILFNNQSTKDISGSVLPSEVSNKLFSRSGEIKEIKVNCLRSNFIL